MFMVMDCLDHELKALLDQMTQPFDQGEIKCLMLQLLSAVAFMHANWCVHDRARGFANPTAHRTGFVAPIRSPGSFIATSSRPIS